MVKSDCKLTYVAGLRISTIQLSSDDGHAGNGEYGDTTSYSGTVPGGLNYLKYEQLITAVAFDAVMIGSILDISFTDSSGEEVGWFDSTGKPPSDCELAGKDGSFVFTK